MVEIVLLHQPSTAAEILADYGSKGNASIEVAELQISVADWRRIARQVEGHRSACANSGQRLAGGGLTHRLASRRR